jgi:hypothetical protein
MSEFPAVVPESGDDRDGTESESSDALLPELEALEERLHELVLLVRRLREENAALREQGAQLGRERETLRRERGLVSARLTQIIAKVDALRGET